MTEKTEGLAAEVRARRGHGESVADIAAALKVSRSYVYTLLRGEGAAKAAKRGRPAERQAKAEPAPSGLADGQYIARVTVGKDGFRVEPIARVA